MESEHRDCVVLRLSGRITTADVAVCIVVAETTSEVIRVIPAMNTIRKIFNLRRSVVYRAPHLLSITYCVCRNPSNLPGQLSPG